MKHRHRPDPPWTPFVQVALLRPDEIWFHEMAATVEQPVETVRSILNEEDGNLTGWQNSRYLVLKRPARTSAGWPAMIHLSIRRLDRGVLRVWRDLQRIKNELVGSENEAVEMFPAESRLMDATNQYHLWVLIDAKVRFPFGYTARAVRDHDPAFERIAGTRQEPLEEKL